MNILKLCQEGSVTMALPQIQEPTFYTEEEYYSLPEGVRSELISGQLYDMAPPVESIRIYYHISILRLVFISVPKTAPVRSIQPLLLSS